MLSNRLPFVIPYANNWSIGDDAGSGGDIETVGGVEADGLEIGAEEMGTISKAIKWAT